MNPQRGRMLHRRSYSSRIANMLFLWNLIFLCVFAEMVNGYVYNAALHRPVNSSSVYRTSGQPGKGVDGDTSSVSGKVVNTDMYQPLAWWTVNLERQVVDADVVVFFRTDNNWRRNGVEIYTSKTIFSAYPEGQSCHNFTGYKNGTGIPDVGRVKCPGSWRHLMLFTETNNDGFGPTLDFGEVQVLVPEDTMCPAVSEKPQLCNRLKTPTTSTNLWLPLIVGISAVSLVAVAMTITSIVCCLRQNKVPSQNSGMENNRGAEDNYTGMQQAVGGGAVYVEYDVVKEDEQTLYETIN